MCLETMTFVKDIPCILHGIYGEPLFPCMCRDFKLVSQLLFCTWL